MPAADRVLPRGAARCWTTSRPTSAPTATSGPTSSTRLDRLVLKPVDGYGGEGVLIGPLATEAELAATRRQMLAAPHRWIAQEMIELSTHPTLRRRAARPAARRPAGLRLLRLERAEVAPAALTRVAPAGSMVVNSSRGGGSKDTWLLE